VLGTQKRTTLTIQQELNKKKSRGRGRQDEKIGGRGRMLVVTSITVPTHEGCSLSDDKSLDFGELGEEK